MDEPAPPQNPPPLDQEPREPAPAAPEESADPLELAPEDRPTETETTTRPAQGTRSMWNARLTRREIVTGLGITAGVVGLGVGLAALAGSPAAPQTTGGPAPQETTPPPTARSSPPPTVHPVRLAQTLEDWRTRRLTIQPAQRFQPQTGSAVVPLGVIEPAYPNPYNPSTVHLHAYLLGGEVIGKLQLFWYLGLEARDGTQFVAKLRVGPLDQAANQFSVLVTQQAQDTIAGGGTPEYPPAQVTPKALAQALPVVMGHCVVVVLIRQTLPPEAQGEGIPPALFQEINQQVNIADRFLAVDYAVVHTTPLSQVPPSDLAAIHNVIDTQPITYRTPTDGGKYPLITQVVLRHSDQLFPKLGG